VDTVLAPGESGVHFRIETETRSLSFVQEGSDAVTKKKKGRMQIQTEFFLSSTWIIRNNHHFYYVCIDYCNTFNCVCTGLTVYMNVLSVIPNLCNIFQNLKIVTEVLTKREHFHML